MDFEIPRELKMLRDLVRRFVRDELMPLEKTMDDSWELPPELDERLKQKAKSLGLVSLSVPKEYGGQGLGALGISLVREELARTIVPFKIPGEPSPILYACNLEQKERFLDPCIRGEKECFFGQTEPNAGSDPASMETTAVRDGDNWIINGTKLFITSAHKCDFGQVFAVTDKEKRQHGGITCFLVEKGTPGFRIVRRIEIMGRENPCELVFENCVVPHANVLGEVGQGFILAQKWLSASDRLGLGAQAVGLSERCLEMARDYAKQRVTFGRPLADRQAIQWMLAESALEIQACRMLTYYGAWKYDRGENIRVESSMVRMYASEMQWRIVDRALQVHGGIGLSEDLPLAKMYRHVRSYRITGGSSEMQRFIIARAVLGGWKGGLE